MGLPVDTRLFRRWSCFVLTGAIFFTIAGCSSDAGDQHRLTNSSKLKAIAVAMHEFHETHGWFPPRKTRFDSQNGRRQPLDRPKLSWRVHLLPMLGEQQLYGQFALDEDWDSPTNRPLMERIPEAYLAAGIKVPRGHTPFLGIDMPGAMYENGGGAYLGEMLNGTATKVMVVIVEPGLAVEWTKPQDYRPSTESPAAGLYLNGGVHSAAFADGSARSLLPSISSEVWINIFKLDAGILPTTWQEIEGTKLEPGS